MIRPRAADTSQATDSFSDEDLRFIREAAEYLEKPRFLMRVANAVGRPLDWSARKFVPGIVTKASTRALNAAMRAAVKTIHAPHVGRADDSLQASLSSASRTGRLHQGTAFVTGAGGGFFGAAGLLVELPVTTTVMLRSIADIARQYGEDLDDPEVRLECLSVFAHGCPTPGDDDQESTYLTTKLATARLVKDAGRFVAKESARSLARHLAEGTAPLLVRLVAQIAARFKIVVSQKLLAQTIPVVGAGTGALINVAFTDHFNRVARYHFGIRRLDREHGREIVQATYRRMVHEVKG
jgi:hypothetical protein